MPCRCKAGNGAWKSRGRRCGLALAGRRSGFGTDPLSAAARILTGESVHALETALESITSGARFVFSRTPPSADFSYRRAPGPPSKNRPSRTKAWFERVQIEFLPAMGWCT